jgi:hypothetical protein
VRGIGDAANDASGNFDLFAIKHILNGAQYVIRPRRGGHPAAFFSASL